MQYKWLSNDTAKHAIESLPCAGSNCVSVITSEFKHPKFHLISSGIYTNRNGNGNQEKTNAVSIVPFAEENIQERWGVQMLINSPA